MYEYVYHIPNIMFICEVCDNDMICLSCTIPYIFPSCHNHYFGPEIQTLYLMPNKFYRNGCHLAMFIISLCLKLENSRLFIMYRLWCLYNRCVVMACYVYHVLIHIYFLSVINQKTNVFLIQSDQLQWYIHLSDVYILSTKT